MEKIICKNCNETIASPGIANRSFAGTFMTCSECGDELKKESYLLKLSEAQVTLFCKKCLIKLRKRTGLKCPKCGTINN
jgi:primosomal protein N'